MQTSVSENIYIYRFISVKKYSKLKYKNKLQACLIYLYFLSMFPRFKDSHQELSQEKKPKEPWAKTSFSYQYLFLVWKWMSFMSFNVFHQTLSCLSQLKIVWIAFCISFLLRFSQIFISPWRLYHLVEFTAKLWDDNLVLLTAFLLLKLYQFKHIPLYKTSFL